MLSLLLTSLFLAAPAPSTPAVAEGQCDHPRPAVLHCGVAGSDPSFQRGFECSTYVCMEKLSTAPLADGAVRLLDQKGKPIAGQVAVSDRGFSFTPVKPLAAGKYELVVDRWAFKSEKGDAVTMNNAEESVGRFRFCFDTAEDPRLRNNPSDTVNGCAWEREKQGRLPAFLQAARFIDVQRGDIKRVDRIQLVREFVATAFDWDTFSASRPSAPVAATLSFKDAAEKQVGTAVIDCDGFLCFAPGGCFRANLEKLNRDLYFNAGTCAAKAEK
ncbi:MAG: hypothetical protein QM765_34400 [Myxococcales bacterium]